MSATPESAGRVTSPLVAVVLLTVMAVGLSACVKPAPDVQSLAQVGAGDMVLVGKVELVPPLKPGEQNIALSGPYNDENTVFFFVNGKHVPVSAAPAETLFESVIMAPFGETFFVKQPRRPTYLTVSFVYMTLTRQTQERIWLPGGLVVEPQPGDRAVYVGTLRYHRNAFFDLEKAELLDEYEQARQAFRARFGADAQLAKRLARNSSP